MMITWAELNAVAQHMDEHPNASGPMYAPLLLGWTRALLTEVERLKAAHEQALEERQAIAGTANNLSRENAELRDMIAEVQRACDKARSAQAYDNPELDGTDGAHPAWWRGDEHGTEMVMREVNKWLDGAPVKGSYGSQRLNEMRERVSDLRGALNLLWEEVNDEERCAQERAPGVYRHQVSEPCRGAVLRALKGEAR